MSPNPKIKLKGRIESMLCRKEVNMKNLFLWRGDSRTGEELGKLPNPYNGQL